MTYQKHTGAVRRFAKFMKVAAWIQNLPNKLTPPPFRLMQIGSAFWQSRALHVVAKMDIATLLSDGEQDAAQLAKTIGANPDAVTRLMRFMVAMGVFEVADKNTYRNNKLSSYLRTDKPDNVRAMILMHNSAPMSRPWYEQLELGIRQGVPPFQLANGELLFDYLDTHPDMDALFSDAMNCVEALSGDNFATDFDWRSFRRIIDVGGSRGTKSLAILRHHPQLTALVVDRKPVIDEALNYWKEYETKGVERLSFETGDILVSIPPAQDEGDIYLLSGILHAFDDETCILILRNLASAIGDSGARAALLEMVLPETNADLAGASFDMQMLMGSQGRERTLPEWQSLFDRSDMMLEEVVGTRSFVKIQVITPKS